MKLVLKIMFLHRLCSILIYVIYFYIFLHYWVIENRIGGEKVSSIYYLFLLLCMFSLSSIPSFVFFLWFRCIISFQSNTYIYIFNHACKEIIDLCFCRAVFVVKKTKIKKKIQSKEKIRMWNVIMGQMRCKDSLTKYNFHIHDTFLDWRYRGPALRERKLIAPELW